MRRRLPSAAGLALAITAFAWSSNGAAQEVTSDTTPEVTSDATPEDPPVVHIGRDQIVLQSGTVSGSDGRISINIAAGAGNQQMAAVSVAVGDFATTTGVAQQFLFAPSGEDRTTSIDIPKDAFTGVSGLLSINISAGTLNQSANLAQLAVGSIAALSDQLLEQARASTEPRGGTGSAADTPNDAIHLSDGAFADNSGLVQLNLVGGERNSSANVFQLSFSAGANP